MAKQSCSSTRFRSSGPTPADFVSLARSVARQRVHVRQNLAGLLPGVGGENRRRNFDGAAPLVRIKVFSFASLTTTAAAAPSQLAEHIGRVFG